MHYRSVFSKKGCMQSCFHFLSRRYLKSYFLVQALHHKCTSDDLKCYLVRQPPRFWSRAYESLLRAFNDEVTADRLSVEVTDALCYIILSSSHGCFIAEPCDRAESKLYLTVNVSLKVPRAEATGIPM